MSLIGYVLSFVNKRICTSEQFIKACEKATKLAEEDEDGYMTIRELITIVRRSI